MTYAQYCAAIGRGPHEQRLGQYAFNLLYTVRPDLSEQVRGDPALDPFYDSSKLDAFLLWLWERW